MATLTLARNLVSTGRMDQISMKEDPSPPRAVTECDTPWEIGLTKQGCCEMMYIYHPAVLNLGHLVSMRGGGGRSHGQNRWTQDIFSPVSY